MVKIRRVLQAPIARDARDSLEKMRFRKEMKKADMSTNDKMFYQYRNFVAKTDIERIADFQRNLVEAKERAKRSVEEWKNPFANGRKGKDYECTFPLPPFIRGPVFEGLKDIGLSFSINKTDGTATIKGCPTEAGEFKITLKYGYPELIGRPLDFIKKNLLARELDLSIFPDPRDLWNNIPTPLSIEYYKKDERAEILKGDGYIMAGASVRGRSHAHTGLPRDDDFALGKANGWKILMVADGAGSAPYSRAGSAIACEHIKKFCENYLNHDNELASVLEGVTRGQEKAEWYPAAKRAAYALAPKAVFDAWQEIKGEAGKLEREPKEYATTLLLAVCREFPAGWFVVSFQVGDGAMALVSDGQPRLLAEPDEGEYGGQTRFITMKEIYQSDELMRRLNIDLVPSLDALILMTDGVSDARFSTLANLRDGARWIELLRELEPLVHSDDPGTELLSWLQFWSEGNHDDRSLAILREEK